MCRAAGSAGNRIIVTIERREDGGLYVYSDDIPGFVLSHLDAHAVLADMNKMIADVLLSDGETPPRPLPSIPFKKV